LGKELVKRVLTNGEHEGLITVVAGAKITRLERPGHSNLCQLFAITKNAELRLAAQHFAAADQAGLAAAVRQTIIGENIIPHKGGVCSFWHVRFLQTEDNTVSLS